jgi:hypothetical protein
VKSFLLLSASPRNPARLFAGTPTFYKVLGAAPVNCRKSHLASLPSHGQTGKK